MERDVARLDRRTFLATAGAGLLAGCAESRREPTAEEPTGTPGATSTGTPTRTASTSTASPTERSPDPPSLAGSWPGFGYDLGNSGLNPDTASPAGLSLVWSRRVEGNNTLPEPAVAGSGVFVGSGTQFYAVNRRDGTSLWTRDLGLPTYQYSPAVADDTVFAVARDLASAWRGGDEAGVLMAIGAESGAIRWQRDALVNSSPIVRGDLLYHAATSSDRGFLRARSTSGGAERWSYEFGSDDEPSRSFGVPAIADDVVFATGSVGPERDTTGHLVALDPATGEELWTETFSAAVELTPVYSDGSVFVASEDGRLSSIDAETRSTVWARQFEKPLLSKPSVGNGLVYCLSKERVTAVDRASGETVWRRTVAPVQSTITVTSTAVYVGGDDMDVFDAATGEPRWQREIDGYSGAFGVPVVVNGYVYVGACVKPTGEAAYDNYVYVLG